MLAILYKYITIPISILCLLKYCDTKIDTFLIKVLQYYKWYFKKYCNNYANTLLLLA